MSKSSKARSKQKRKADKAKRKAAMQALHDAAVTSTAARIVTKSPGNGGNTYSMHATPARTPPPSVRRRTRSWRRR